MKNLTTVVITLLALATLKSFAEDSEFSLTFGGFVKTDAFYDTRQTVNIREGHFLLYPQSKNLDSYGNDLSANPQFNILSIQSRVNVTIKGPGIFGAKSNGFVEAEFFGSNDAVINAVRMRHAYMELDWENSKLLAGQTWHPMFIAESYPEVLSFNTGVPFEPFNRSPQIRFTQTFDFLNISLTALTQRDFADFGPYGSSSEYARNAAMPEFYLGLQAKFTETLFGFVGGIKQIKPMTYYTFIAPTDKQIVQEIDEKLSTYGVTGYFKTKTGDLTFKAQGTYGSNLTDLLFIGGYSGFGNIIDTNINIVYNAFNTASGWAEFIYNFGPEAGLFVGYTKNMGLSEIQPGGFMPYGRGLNIDNVYRISPRLTYTFKKNKVGIEFEYTTAAYGTNDITDKMKVINSKEVSNLRVLLSFIANF